MEILPPGCEKISVSFASPPDHSQVRVQFDRQLSYIILPKEHAIHFAIMILEHAGAELENLAGKTLTPPPTEPPAENL